MVGGSRPLVRGRRFRVPLLAVLTIRQQAARRFRSLNPIACRVPIAPAPVAIPRVKLARRAKAGPGPRSEEHTSELQSLAYLVCRLLLEKKKKNIIIYKKIQKKRNKNFPN